MIDRQAVYNKYNGHCAYCGCELNLKDMQVDHILPKMMKHFVGNPRADEYFGVAPRTLDDFGNLMPSCRKCNFYKSAETLEIFRKKIKTMTDRLQKIYIFNLAVKYNTVEVKEWDGLFYFEKERNVCR